MAINQELKDIIKRIKFAKDIKQADIAKSLDVKEPYLSDMINGRVPFNNIFKNKIYEVYSDCLNPIVKADESNTNTKDSLSAVTETRPRLPITARGGMPNGFGDSVILSECEQVPVIKALPAYDFTMIVTGDSMEPNYVGGDEIAIRRVNEIIEYGSVYVLDTADGAIIKRLYDEGTHYRCVSYNKEYQDFLVDKTSVFGVYKVVGLIRI